MVADSDDDETTVDTPLTAGLVNSREDDDIDSAGLVPLSQQRPFVSSSSSYRTLSAGFNRLWRRLPDSWSGETDSERALGNLLTLASFIALCVFVFALPSLLHFVSPQAVTPPGTAPNVDEASPMISGLSGAVAADHPDCSALGVKVLNEMSGNAVDAMVATVLCQGVLAPFASGIGGGAFILVHSAAKQTSRFYDAREIAPSASTRTMFVKAKKASASRFGGLAVGVPGELRGLHKAHADWGVLPWSDVVLPAAKLAKESTVGPLLALRLKQMNNTVHASPSLTAIFTKKKQRRHTAADAQSTAAASVELPGVRRSVKKEANQKKNAASDPGRRDGVEMSDPDDANNSDLHGVTSLPPNAAVDGNATYVNVVLEEGDPIRNLQLASTLRHIAERGPDFFYDTLAANFSRDIRDAGGIMKKSDISSYRVVVREPLVSHYHNVKILGAPLPSSGGACVGMTLNILEGFKFRSFGRNALAYGRLVEALKWVFAARMELGDPAFVPRAKTAVSRMLSRRLAMKIRGRIDVSRTYGPSHYGRRIRATARDSGTTHVSIVDKDGLAVSITSTINLPFGSGVVSGGVITNNEMDDFSTDSKRPNAFGLYPTKENEIAAGKRPLSSMSPTIAVVGSWPYLVVGGSGGPRIITAVVQTINNVLDFGDTIADAISAPRLHHQLVPNRVQIESANTTTCELFHALQRPSGGNGATGKGAWQYWPSVCRALKLTGHNVTGPSLDGCVQAVLVPDALSRKTEQPWRIYAASDQRKMGKAAAF